MRFKLINMLILSAVILPTCGIRPLGQNHLSPASLAPKKLVAFHIDFNTFSLNIVYLRQFIRFLAGHGYNAILWEVEEGVQWDTIPVCSKTDSLTKKEFKEIVDYARSLGLEPIPLLQTVAHSEYILKHQEYINLSENEQQPNSFCLTNPKAKRLLKQLIHEYLSVFGAIRFFHLGGDEAKNISLCNTCSAFTHKHGLLSLYCHHLNELAKDLIARGIRPCIWSDMILRFPSSISIVPHTFIIWDWNYWDGVQPPDKVILRDQGKFLSLNQIPSKDLALIPELISDSGRLNAFYTIDFLIKQKFDVVICPSSRSLGDPFFAGRHHVHAPNIIGAAKKCITTGTLGICTTSWGIRIFNYRLQIPWIILVPLALNHPNDSCVTILEKASYQLFNRRDLLFYQSIDMIGTPFLFDSAGSTGIEWNGLKDGSLPPRNFIHNLIDKMKNSHQLPIEQQQIINAKNRILAGKRMLATFAKEATDKIDVIHEWLTAADFQLQQADIASRILKVAATPVPRPSIKLVNIIRDTRSRYCAWAKEWLSESSAIKAADLIYFALAEYAKKP